MKIFPGYLDQTMGAACPLICNAGGGGGGKGGSPSVPPPPPPPEKAQVSKPVTEAATSARQAQKDKAGKAAGLRGSILTGPMQSGGDQGSTKTLLGQ